MTLTPKALESSQSRLEPYYCKVIWNTLDLFITGPLACNFQDHRIGAPHARKVLLFACTGDARFPMDYLSKPIIRFFNLSSIGKALTKKTKLIMNSVSNCRQVHRRHRVKKTSRKALDLHSPVPYHALLQRDHPIQSPIQTKLRR